MSNICEACKTRGPLRHILTYMCHEKLAGIVLFSLSHRVTSSVYGRPPEFRRRPARVCGAESELAAVVTSRERLSSRAPLYSYCVCSSGVSQCCRLSCRLNCRYLTVVSVAFLLLLLLLAVLSRLRVSDSDCLSVFLSNLDITVMILH